MENVGAVDLIRLPEFLLEKWNKWNAETPIQLEEAEAPPQFKFGYEYSYVLLVMTVVTFYSTVVPLILPVGLVFILIKHVIDKVCIERRAANSRSCSHRHVHVFTFTFLG